MELLLGMFAVIGALIILAAVIAARRGSGRSLHESKGNREATFEGGLAGFDESHGDVSREPPRIL